MAEIAAVSKEGNLNRPGWLWETVGNGDTCDKKPIQGGRYAFIVEGDYDSAGDVELYYAKGENTTPYSIDGTNLSLTAVGLYVVDLPSGYVKPTITSALGASADVDIYLVPLPGEPA